MACATSAAAIGRTRAGISLRSGAVSASAARSPKRNSLRLPLSRLGRKVLEGELSDEHRERLVEIANRCPVHRTLEGEIHITTTLAS